jgi:hypothetical protein
LARNMGSTQFRLVNGRRPSRRIIVDPIFQTMV